MFDLKTLTVSAWIGLFFTAMFLFAAIYVWGSGASAGH